MPPALRRQGCGIDCAQRVESAGALIPGDADLSSRAPRLFVEIPVGFDAMLATDWLSTIARRKMLRSSCPPSAVASNALPTAVSTS